ncbi:MAG: amidohydrolase family protein [Steroidobacteraceae bacterium]
MQHTVAPRMPSAPHKALPANSCDTHAHIFGPFDRYPLKHPAGYDVPDAPVTRYLQMLDTVGITRGVLVQPAPYGTDPTAVLDALAGSRARLRGIAVGDASIHAQELKRWHEGGICGLRFADMTDATGHTYAGQVSAAVLPDLAPRMQELGMHAQLWATIDNHIRVLPELVKLGMPLVLDHMGMIQTARGLNDPGFVQLLRHLERGEIYVKLALCRVATSAPEYPELKPFHDAMVAANPERLLWGSDWPYVRLADKSPDVGALIDRAFDWIPEAKVRQKVFAENPARLYGF